MSNFQKSYRDQEWFRLRRRILERDNYTCGRCGKKLEESQLHVHHMRYEREKLAWQYQECDLITLCKFCHAEEHNKVRPTFGWEYCGMEDFGDLAYECDYCGTPLRFANHIYHPGWGYMIVGRDCAEKLTSATDLSQKEKDLKNKSNRFRTFCYSNEWSLKKNNFNCLTRKYNNYYINIWNNLNYFTAEIRFFYIKEGKKTWETYRSRHKFESEEAAKYAVFNSIDSGKMKTYIERYFPNTYEPPEEEYYY